MQADNAGGGSAEDAEGRAPMTTTARFLRAVRVLRPNCGHCIWTDRAMCAFDTLDSVVAAGFHVTSVMLHNRIGLPRRLLAALKSRMACPSKCKHGMNAVGCRRWSWCVLHKGQWELCVWSDGRQLVSTVSDCTSATRLIELSRFTDGSTMLPLAPEPIGMYNVFGRGPTDGGDGQRKRLGLAVRRQVRQGPKGQLSDFELALVGATALANGLRDETTVWDIANEYSSDVLSSVSMRERSSASLAAATTTAADGCEEAAHGTRAATAAQQEKHRPRWFAQEARKRRRAEAASDGDARDGPCPAPARGAKCCMAPACAPGEPKQPYIFCAGCKQEREKCSGWYHFDCYWKRHKAVSL